MLYLEKIIFTILGILIAIFAPKLIKLVLGGKHEDKYSEPMDYTQQYETTKAIAEAKQKEEIDEVKQRDMPGIVDAMREQLKRILKRSKGDTQP